MPGAALQPGKGYIYIILLTARDAIEHVVTGLQSGADDYLTKPVIEPELIARLNTGRRIVTLERSLRTANEENRRLSITDPLTGAYNRRYLMEQLPREIDRAARYGRQLADGHVRRRSLQEDQRHARPPGRRRGAEVVRRARCRSRRARQRLGRALRRRGIRDRAAGDQRRQRGHAAEHLRAQIAATPFPASTAEFAGVGELRRRPAGKSNVPQGSTFDALIARCDAGVYASKAAGRNCVTTRPLDQ